MLTNSLSRAVSTIKFEYANWGATDALPRDRAQSQHLHEPEYLIDTIDPMTGENVQHIEGHPSVVDGKLTIYFATEATRKADVDLSLKHLNLRVPFATSDEDDRGDGPCRISDLLLMNRQRYRATGISVVRMKSRRGCRVSQSK